MLKYLLVYSMDFETLLRHLLRNLRRKEYTSCVLLEVHRHNEASLAACHTRIRDFLLRHRGKPIRMNSMLEYIVNVANDYFWREILQRFQRFLPPTSLVPCLHYKIMPNDTSTENLASLVAPLYSMFYEPIDSTEDNSHGMVRPSAAPQHIPYELHESHDTVTDGCNGVPKLTRNFQQLPRELRDEIYRYVIDDIGQLNLSASSWLPRPSGDDPRHPLLRRIPRCLLLNQQILHEALEIAPDTVSGIKAFSAEDTTCVFPSNVLLRNVRRLEFTLSHPTYSSNGRDTCSAPQDVASRCTQLEELSILLPATTAMTYNYQSDLVNIFENKNLVKLTLNYEKAPWRGWDQDYCLFQPLESWFLQECGKRRRHVDFTIDLAPGRVTRSIEESKVRKGCIEYMQCIDIFG